MASSSRAVREGSAGAAAATLNLRSAYLPLPHEPGRPLASTADQVRAAREAERLANASV